MVNFVNSTAFVWSLYWFEWPFCGTSMDWALEQRRVTKRHLVFLLGTFLIPANTFIALIAISVLFLQSLSVSEKKRWILKKYWWSLRETSKRLPKHSIGERESCLLIKEVFSLSLFLSWGPFMEIGFFGGHSFLYRALRVSPFDLRHLMELFIDN